MTLAVVRVRGTINIKRDIRDTLAMLGLTRVNHCILIPESPQYKGMLQKVKDYVTWGSLDEDTATRLIQERGRMSGGHPVDGKALKALGSFKSVDALAKAVVEGKVTWSKLEGAVPVFRLHPPRKGYEGIKRAYGEGGALGDRGQDINGLLQRML